MPYENIPGTRVTYEDGAFKTLTASSQPTILAVGPASSGRTNELYFVNEVSVAEKEFGAATEIMRVVHEAIGEGADNLAVVRSGGKEGSWVFTDSDSNTLTITPSYRDNDILGRYAVVIENDGSSNRFLVRDLTDQAWVYDSDDILVLDDGIVTVEDTGIDLFTLNDRELPDSAIALDTVVIGDFTADGAATATSAVATEGTDGTDVSLVERYAALTATYHLLDYRDADFVIPTDVYIDDENIIDDTTHTEASGGATDAEKYGYFWKGVPALDSAEDALGFVWEYRYKGKVYTYFTDVDDYFAGVSGAAAATVTVDTDIVLTALKDGKGGNGVTIQISDVLGKTAEVSVTETDHGLDILVQDDITTSASLRTLVVTNINTALGLETLRSGVLADTLVQASGGSAVGVGVVAKTNLAGGEGGAVLTHANLTAESIPSAVSTKFAAGADAELREVNFAHQLASFLHLASTNWSVMLGLISFKAPPNGYSRNKIADWIGVAPEYTNDGTDIYIDAPTDNGSGVLGHKLLSGQSASGAGYRSSEVDGGDTTDGYAYGGLILTKGSALPNGEDWPYGISDSDEAVDSGGKPVDIGKHILVRYDYPILNNGYNGGTRYRGSEPGLVAGKIATMKENEEPIGINGQVQRASSPTRVHSTQIDDLAAVRIGGLRRDTGGEIIITTAKTAAHPDSDYTRLSTIRCVNRMLAGIRNLARPYIGKEFSVQRLASLQSTIDAFIVSERGAGIHQGARARIEYTREDRIMGRLKIKLRMVPPFSIEGITVETSLAADESEL